LRSPYKSYQLSAIGYQPGYQLGYQLGDQPRSQHRWELKAES